jgi:hypothetical protein
MLDADAIRVVVVFTADGAAGFTVIVTMLELEALKLTAPEYAALTELVPVGSIEVEMLATPPESDADPSREEPL